MPGRALLADDAMIGKGAVQPLDHHRLHLAVGIGDQVDDALVLDALLLASRLAQPPARRDHRRVGDVCKLSRSDM